MSQSPIPPPKKKRKRKRSRTLRAYGLALVAAVAGAGFYGVLLFRGTQQKPVTSAAPRPVAPASNTIIAKTAAPEAPKPDLKTTLAQIAKEEAAKQGTAAGPLYDKRSKDVALSYESLNLDDPQVVEARALLAKYEKASSWRERLAFVYQPERCEPLMKEHYEKRGQQEPEHGDLAAAGIISAGTSKVLNLQFPSATRPDSGMRANFHRIRAGGLLLDWESWVAWSEKPWASLKKDRLALPVVMRAVASESSYFNYEFGEDWRWLPVKLRSPDGLHNITGYVPKTSMLAVALGNLIGVPVPAGLKEGTPIPALRPSGSKALVTVRVVFPPNAQSDHCVKIIDLLADRWLVFPTERQ
jgi:hypothetical protein